jgi:hypothetical protein
MGLLNEIYRMSKTAEGDLYATAQQMTTARNQMRTPDASFQPGLSAMGIGQNGAAAPARTTTFPGAQVSMAQGARQAGRDMQFQMDNQRVRNQMISSGAIQGAGKAPRANVLPKSEFMPLGGKTASINKKSSVTRAVLGKTRWAIDQPRDAYDDPKISIFQMMASPAGLAAKDALTMSNADLTSVIDELSAAHAAGTVGSLRLNSRISHPEYLYGLMIAARSRGLTEKTASLRDALVNPPPIDPSVALRALSSADTRAYPRLDEEYKGLINTHKGLNTIGMGSLGGGLGLMGLASILASRYAPSLANRGRTIAAIALALSPLVAFPVGRALGKKYIDEPNFKYVIRKAIKGSPERAKAIYEYMNSKYPSGVTEIGPLAKNYPAQLLAVDALMSNPPDRAKTASVNLQKADHNMAILEKIINRRGSI